MGQAKAKNSGRSVLTEAMRANMLGNDPFNIAYKFLYEQVEQVYTSKGGFPNTLIGMHFDNGLLDRLYPTVIRRLEDVPGLRHAMLQYSPMVAHVFEAWTAPPDRPDLSPSQHPERKDCVTFMLHTSDLCAVARCIVNPAMRTIQHDELFYPDKVGGRLGRDLPNMIHH
ncbi:hypothetical protein [Comamonas testosteroni]|uniref:Uncharacterized protein n=1 Tax=Comamonas testosteroni TaxID=285 RepID=A0A096FME0_COMTE|nr:hypothetical protein [Comamonas testosteroni]KGH30938.1 hypothetical protein P353_08740 [Comamonas testosteroni]WKL18849.1 hypothetical protein QYQ99_28005 [Comamonas testosteroni]